MPTLLRATHFCNSVVDTLTGNVLKYRHLICGPAKKSWTTALANDLGWLAQGMGTQMKSVTSTIFFDEQSAVPAGRKVLYCTLVASLRPNKTKTHRVRVTAGGNLLECPDATATGTASTTKIKCLLNSVISTPGGKFMTADIKDFYYGLPLSRFECVCMHLADTLTILLISTICGL